MIIIIIWFMMNCCYGGDGFDTAPATQMDDAESAAIMYAPNNGHYK